MDFSQLSLGMCARIISISPEHSGRDRLMEMGLIPGTEFCVNKIAPFGDPVEIEFRGYRLCLRLSEGKGIQVEVIP